MVCYTLGINGEGKMNLLQKSVIKEYAAKLHQLYPDEIDKIILFGSQARGDASKQADIDILIVTKNNHKKIKNDITDLAFDIILKYAVDLEPVIFNRLEWKKLTRKPTSFIHCVLQEGKEL